MADELLLFEKITQDLVELKDTSEMMMDLAYSPLLLNSGYLAEEVRLLEDKVDRLHTEFELLVLSSGAESQETRGLLGLIRMGVVTERIADAAVATVISAMKSFKRSGSFNPYPFSSTFRAFLTKLIVYSE